jgi:hypothetical protein
MPIRIIHIYYYSISCRFTWSRNNYDVSVALEKGYCVGVRGSIPGERSFSFLRSTIPSLGFKQPPIQGVLWAPSSGKKGPDSGTDCLPPTADVKKKTNLRFPRVFLAWFLISSAKGFLSSRYLVSKLSRMNFSPAFRGFAAHLHLKCAAPIFTLYMVEGSACGRSLPDMFPVHRPTYV